MSVYIMLPVIRWDFDDSTPAHLGFLYRAHLGDEIIAEYKALG